VVNESSFFLGKSINLCPPGQGPAVKTVNLEHKVKAKRNPKYGMIKIEVDAGDSIDGLFEKEEKYVGMYNEFIGGINLNPQKLN
jgi:hypothetical protein